MEKITTPFKGVDGYYHYVYETTNLVNGKKYIGKHSTPIFPNKYIGCGIKNISTAKRMVQKGYKGFPAAVVKYGYEMFDKEVISFFGTAEKAFNFEEQVVGEKIVKSSSYYNIIPGGGNRYIGEDNSKFKGTEKFIEESRRVHGNLYDYSETKYINSKSKLKIICKKHGVFKQLPSSHLNGRGCSKCGGTHKNTTEDIIKRFIETHGDRYDYSSTEYINGKTKVRIRCRVHGIFEQLCHDHIRGFGCRKCSGVDKGTTKSFIKRAKEVHLDKYDYSKSVYTNSHNKLIIICPKHGPFEMSPEKHLIGQGCKRCYGKKGVPILDTTTGIVYKSITDYCNKNPDKDYRKEYGRLHYGNSHLKYLE